MLRISRKADYAVFLLGSIARKGAYPGGDAEELVVSAQETATAAGLNKSVVANLLKAFARHGILESVRGLRGGYRLQRAPQEISLAEILEVVEGPFHLVDCIHQQMQQQMHQQMHQQMRQQKHQQMQQQLQPQNRQQSHPLSHSREAKPGKAIAPRVDDHVCTLIGFCPTKTPMRLVHERIADLFHEIRLDELCGLHPRAAAPAALRS